MNAVFAPDREHTGAREPRPSSQGDELKSTLALQPFRLQFISSAPDRGPSIVTEVEIQASDASAAIVAAGKLSQAGLKWRQPSAVSIHIGPLVPDRPLARRANQRLAPSRVTFAGDADNAGDRPVASPIDVSSAASVARQPASARRCRSSVVAAL
jgi:hypothetical protein